MSTGQIVIQPMAIDDIPAVYHLGERCLDEAIPPYSGWSVQEVVDYLTESPDVCHVAKVDGQVVGFVLGSEAFGRMKNTGCVEWVGVDPDHRRRGIGRALLAQALETLHQAGVSRVVADVVETNTAARAMVTGLDFVENLSLIYHVKAFD